MSWTVGRKQLKRDKDSKYIFTEAIINIILIVLSVFYLKSNQQFEGFLDIISLIQMDLKIKRH